LKQIIFLQIWNKLTNQAFLLFRWILHLLHIIICPNMLRVLLERADIEDERICCKRVILCQHLPLLALHRLCLPLVHPQRLQQDFKLCLPLVEIIAHLLHGLHELHVEGHLLLAERKFIAPIEISHIPAKHGIDSLCGWLVKHTGTFGTYLVL